MDTRTSLIPLLVASLPSEYEIVDNTGAPCTADNAHLVGSGGSSIVLRAIYRGRLPRAIKIIIPRDDLHIALDTIHFISSYENEVVRLAELSHEHIAKITDFASVKLPSGEVYPYVGTEFIDGVELSTFAREQSTTGDQIMTVLRQVLDALAYMHDRGVMHCDLKQSNILVRIGSDGEQGASATIVDLGSSKYFPAEIEAGEDGELIYVFATKRYTIPSLQLVLGNWTNNRISKKDLRGFFPQQDLYAFGVILRDLLSDSSVRPKLLGLLSRGDAEALDLVQRRLSNSSAEDAYNNAREVLGALGRLPLRSMAPLGVLELSVVPPRGVVFPGGNVRIRGTDRIGAITSHPLFQRMHKLPQLDLLNYVLPGATHTRFAHTLHTYELAKGAVCNLLADWRFRLDATAQDIESTMFSALLNALGHYHFLHMFEDFLEERRSDPRVERAGLLSDNELLDNLLGQGESEAGNALTGISDADGRTLHDLVADVLRLDWSDVRRRQQKPASPLEGVLAALLSCPVDVDKLAYLIDDSAASGLPFGNAIAPGPVFEALVLPDHRDWSRMANPNPVILGVMERAISYLEQSVLTRYWNIQTGYWHRTNRSLQAMVKFQIASLLRAQALDFGSYVSDTLHLSSDGALRWLNERFLSARARGLIDASVINPLEDLLESRRLIYKRLITISGRSRVPSRAPDHLIFERLRAKSPLEDQEVCDLIAEVLEHIDDGMQIHPGEILLDVPRARREEAGGRVLVYTDDRREELGELFTVSPFLEQHRTSFELHVKRVRVFLHPRLYDRLERRGRIEAAYAASLEALRAEYAS